jgi:predicted permease
VQISLCAVLVTASLVAVRGLVRSLHGTYGIEAKNTMLVHTNLAMARYSAEQQPIMQRRMLDAVQKIPGVTAAAYADSVPLDTETTYRKAYADTTTDLKDSNAAVQMTDYDVSQGFFRTAGTRLLAGREFTLQDDKDAPQVAVVNAEFARKVFGSVEKAMGGHFKVGDGTRIEVVGVSEDGKYININEGGQAAMFRPILQAPSSVTFLVVRSERDPQELTEALRRSLQELDPGLLFSIRTWRQTMDPSFFPARVAAMSLGALGALGALLSITGVFGMAAYSVSKRLREFGIRIALGAQRKEVLRAALGQTFRLLAMGSVAGLLLGVPAGKVLAFIVYQATPWDPIVLGGVVLTMLTLGLVAGWVPARRALAVDPLILLREE